MPRNTRGRFAVEWPAVKWAHLWTLTQDDFLAQYPETTARAYGKAMSRMGLSVRSHDKDVADKTLGTPPRAIQRKMLMAVGKDLPAQTPEPKPAPQPANNVATVQSVREAKPEQPGDAGWVDPDVLWQRITKQRKHGTSVEALADELNAPPRSVRAALKVLQEKRKDLMVDGLGEVRLLQQMAPTEKTIAFEVPGDDITVAIISDTHLVNVNTDLQALHDFYDLCVQRGITTVLHAGDIVEGQGVYRGQSHEIMFTGYGRHLDYVMKNYPKRPGIKTYLCGGNHDESYLVNEGADFLDDLCSRREDIVSVGWYNGRVEIGSSGSDVLRVELQHGRSGNTHAISYQLQQYMNGVPWNKPRPAVYVLGHYHSWGFVRWQGMVGLLGAAWQHTPSRYLTRMANKMGGMVVGGFIIKARVDGDKMTSFTPEWIDLLRKP